MLGTLKLDCLQPAELISSQQIAISLNFILGAPISYYPRERKEGKSRGLKSCIQLLRVKFSERVDQVAKNCDGEGNSTLKEVRLGLINDNKRFCEIESNISF